MKNSENTVRKSISVDDERALKGIEENTPETVLLGNRKVKVHALRYGAISRLTSIMLNETNEHKVTAKAVAVVLLHRLWRIKLFYWALWRWIYYVKEYREDQLTGVLIAAKKKATLESYYTNIMVLTSLKDTTMAMTRAEVERFRREQLGPQQQP